MVFAKAAEAQPYKAEPYFDATEMPDMLKWGILAPPVEGSDAYIYDIKRYYWGKEQRLNPERAAIAIRDAEYGLNTIIREFSIPFGLQISWKHTPKIFALLRDALATTDSICKLPKAFYMRPRPFMVFNEPTLTPNDEASLRRNGSFPSGHSILGWSAALLLSEINPSRTDTLVARGLIFSESRVICGAHFQSDIEAARIAASVAYAKLHTSERFLEQMAAAKKEFMELKDKYQPIKKDELVNDSAYNELKKEVENLKLLERKYRCKIQKYPFEFDKSTRLKMLFIKTNDSPNHVSNGVDYVVLINDRNELLYVVKSVLRHDKESDDEESLYGVYVVGKDKEGEIELSHQDYYSLRRLIFQIGETPEFLNCTSIRYRVAAQPNLIPFAPVSNENREEFKCLFGD